MITTGKKGRNTRRQLLGIMGAALLGGLPLATPAAGLLPGSEPPLLNGNIEDLNLAENKVVIDDREYRLANELRVTAGGRAASRTALHKGQVVEFSVGVGEQSRVINEIRIRR